MTPTTILINGLAGTGSTTVAKLVAEELGYEHVYAGGIFRSMAAAAGKPIETFMSEIAGDPERERAVDDQLIERAKLGNVVVESRVLAWLLPEKVPSHKAWLTCEINERVRRIDQREASQDARQRIEYREKIDVDRYVALYGLDLSDLSVFDQVIDTTSTPATEVAAGILTGIAARN